MVIMNNTTVADIILAMEAIAPSGLAEKWDNSGLQVGDTTWPVKKIGISLDPLPEVVKAAFAKKIDILITHHPLIFSPLKSINLSTPIGGVIEMALHHKIAIYSAHTNLDSVSGGLNDMLACKIGLENIKVLGESLEPQFCKVVIYVPCTHEDFVLEALLDQKLEAAAGKIGNYTCCSFRNTGKGTFKPGSLAHPFHGASDKLSHVDEVRIETIVQKKDLEKVITHVGKSHPYETMAYDVYPLTSPPDEIIPIQGIGRVGELADKTSLSLFATDLKKKLNINSIKLAGKPDLTIKKVALCTGSGAGLMDSFLKSGAEVYISGDFKYHDARTAEAANLGLIDIGHFNSEHIMVKELACKLRKFLFNTGTHVKVEEMVLEKDPFYFV